MSPSDSAVAQDAVAGLKPHPVVASAPRRIGHPVADPTAATLRGYAADWARFVAWCREQQRAALPASAATLAGYLLAVAPTLSRGALGRRRAAIGAMHRQAGLPTPLLTAATRKALRVAARPKPAAGGARLTKADLLRLAAACPRDLAGLRDRALILLVAALTQPKRQQAKPQSPDEGRVVADTVPRLFLLALDAEQVRFAHQGMTLQIRARLSEAEPSRAVALARAATAQSCPVRALEDWLRASDTAFGPVFCKVNRWGSVEHGRLGTDAWHRITARRSGSPRGRRTVLKTQR